MVYEVLARKWRPQVFHDVVGQEHITQTLINAINTDRLAHAYLFSGARGVGKTSVARILAKAVNCQEREDGNPCNKCTSCREITGGSSIDVQEIDGASNRGIDEIRELREYIKYMPSSSKFRVYIIDEVHMLTMQAFNALLKTLEEPPPHVKFIFATTEPHKVPITILSRCQRFDFKRIPLGLIVEQLRKVTDKEGIVIERSGLSIIAREADGSMRDAESLLDQVTSYTGSQVEDHHISDILGIIDMELIFEASGAIIDGLSKNCIEIVERIYNYGYDIKEFYRALMDQFRNLIVCLIAPQGDLLDMADDDIKELRVQAERAGLEKLQQSLNILIAREEALRLTSHSRLVLETIMIKLCQLGDLLSMGELLEKIEAIEKKLTASSFSHDSLSASASISEPEPSWTRGDKDDTEKREEVPRKEGWNNLLDYIKSKNKAMYNVLAEWDVKSVTGDTLKIIRGKSPFSACYLDDPERLKKLDKFCREFFKRDIEIKIIGDKVNNSEKNANITPPRSDLPLPVQEVLEVFNGEIKEEVFAGKEKTKKSSEKKQQGGISNERHS
ncbi:DNA polymerase III subunit gamma/tau [Thermodesulfobacteriota bacterium]